MIILAVLFSFQLSAMDRALTDGIKALERYKKYKNFQIGSSDLENYLEEAYGHFGQSEAPVARLYLFYTGKKLGKTKELQETTTQFVISHRSRYIQMIADMRVLDMDDKVELKNLLMDIEYRVPFIEDIRMKRNTIHPYGHETPEMMFLLNAPSEITLRIEGEIEDKKECDRGGHIFPLTWKNEYLDRVRLGWQIHADSQLIDGSESGELLLETYMPEQLTLDRGSFMLKGVHPKPETRTLKVKDKKILTYGLLSGVALGGLGLMVKRDAETGEEYTKGQRIAIGTITASIIIGVTIYFYLKLAKKKKVPIRENIDFNKKLAQKIDELKGQIEVKMKVKKETGE